METIGSRPKKASATNNNETFISVTVNTFDGLTFPFDASLTRFAKREDVKVSPNTLLDGTERLSGDQEADGSQLNYDSPYTLQNVVRGDRDRKDKNAAVQLPWELHPIFKALIEARREPYKGEVTKSFWGDRLTEPVFFQLLQLLEAVPDQEVLEDYRWVKILEHPLVQHLAIHQFDQEITDRLECIYQWMNRLSPDLLARNMKIICQRLDEILVKIIELTNWDSIGIQQSIIPTHESLEELCKSLLSSREKIKTDNEILSTFNLPYQNNHNSEKSAKAFCDAFAKANELYKRKGKNDEKTKAINCSESAYNQYLIDSLLERKQLDSDNNTLFASYYINIRNYFRSQDRETLESNESKKDPL